MTTTTAEAYQVKPHQTTTTKAPRIEVVDALRGFAIFAIMLLHNLEHFDFYYFPQYLPAWLKSIDSKVWLSRIITTWSNFAFMLILTSCFVYLYMQSAAKSVLHTFAPLGRMSLTNYIVQSIIGTFVYYGYGLGLYQYTGATFCLLIGVLLFTLQLLFCRWWLRRHKQGPLEQLWHRATWI